jgi:hypothetical protein
MLDMARARNWRDVRFDALQAGLITEDGLAEARRRHEGQVRDFRSRQIQETQQDPGAPAGRRDVAKRPSQSLDIQQIPNV